MTGLSGLRGMHASEQRYSDQVSQRDALHREFWSTPDVDRTQQLIDELDVCLVYVGQLEERLHPDGVRKLEPDGSTPASWNDYLRPTNR